MGYININLYGFILQHGVQSVIVSIPTITERVIMPGSGLISKIASHTYLVFFLVQLKGKWY